MKDKVVKVVEKEYGSLVEKDQTLHIHPMWDRDGLYRVRINIRDKDPPVIAKSFFIKVETRDTEIPFISS